MAIQESKPKESLRGQERIQQLIEEFPEIPRTLVVKADALRKGIKPSEVSRLIGRWALPDPKWYFSYDREDNSRRMRRQKGTSSSPSP